MCQTAAGTRPSLRRSVAPTTGGRILVRVRVLLTNDDGIEAEGLQRLRLALLETPGVELAVIAPDGNRSAIGRGITTRRALAVQRLEFDDGTHGYATDGTPVDCVRLAALGLVEGFLPELVVSGINHGANLGDDVTYSGTVAAAMEGLVLGVPAIAVSQQSMRREMDFRLGHEFAFDEAARFTARLVEELERVPLAPSTLLNVNVPAGGAKGVEVARLGRRIYRDRLERQGDDPQTGRRRYFIYGAEPGFEDEPGTDLAAVHAGRVALTPLHMDLTHHAGLGPLSQAQLERLIGAAAQEVEAERSPTGLGSERELGQGLPHTAEDDGR
jgi:5'-nucleotidase